MTHLGAVLLVCLVSSGSSSRLTGIQEDRSTADGIDKYPMAAPFVPEWTDDATLEPLRSASAGEIEKLNAEGSTLTAFEQAEIIRQHWTLEAQKRVNSESCPDLCMMCEPTREEFESNQGFRTVLITREKGWADKVKGLWSKNASTNCGRVGFQSFLSGKKDDDRSWPTPPTDAWYGLKAMRHYQIDPRELSHCEWLRRRPFDVRHAVECLSGPWLCRGRGAIFVPPEERGAWAACRQASKKEGPLIKWGGELTANIIKESLDEQDEKNGKVVYKKCVQLLCKWGGFKKGSRKLHPDRTNHNAALSEEEKASRLDTFTYLNNCKTSFQGADGKELTLNDDQERKETCAED